MDNSHGKSEKLSWITDRTFLAFFGAIFALIFIILVTVINVATQVEDIEGKLAYTPPQNRVDVVPEQSVVSGQRVYVPVYSHIYAKGGKPFLLEATLSVRNSDPDNNIGINSVRYYNTDGKLIKNYLEKPLGLKPLATAEFLVSAQQIEGGSGANFIVEWVSDARVNRPVIEAVMIGIDGRTSISFVRSGVVIED